MKKITLTIIFGLLILIAHAQGTGNTKNVAPVNLDSTLSLIRDQYAIAIQRLSKDGIKNIKLTGVQVIFDISNTTIGNAGISIVIFNANGKLKTKNESTVSFILKKPDNTELKSKELTIASQTTNQLAYYIYTYAKEFDNVKSSTINGLNKQSFEIDITYTIERDASGGLSGNIFKIIGLNGNVENDKAIQHTIKLMFDKN